LKWDKGIDYEYAYNKILRNLFKSRYPSLCYDSILLIQLRNGLRISEAVRAFKHYLQTKAFELEVELSKKKRPEKRRVVVPRDLLGVNLSECHELIGIDDKVLINRLKVYCLTTYRFNTHSLRYSFITYLLRQGVNPSIISKITRHSKLDFILTYTQEKIADDILRSMG